MTEASQQIAHKILGFSSGHFVENPDCLGSSFLATTVVVCGNTNFETGACREILVVKERLLLSEIDGFIHRRSSTGSIPKKVLQVWAPHQDAQQRSRS